MKINKFTVILIIILSIVAAGLMGVGLVMFFAEDEPELGEFAEVKKQNELYGMIVYNEKDQYKQYLDQGDQLEFTFEDGTTPVDKLVEISDIESAKKILESGFNLKDVDNNHIDTVSNVVFYNDDHDNDEVDELVIMLIEQVKDELDQPDRWGLSLLINAVTTNRIDVVREILKHDVDINKSYKGLTALAIACGTTDIDLDIIKLLIENGADVNAVDEDGNNCLFWAIDFGQTYIVNYLLESTTIMINHQNIYGDTALHHSIYSDTVDISNILVNHDGIDVGLKNTDGATPKMLVDEFGYDDLAKQYADMALAEENESLAEEFEIMARAYNDLLTNLSE